RLLFATDVAYIRPYRLLQPSLRRKSERSTRHYTCCGYYPESQRGETAPRLSQPLLRKAAASPDRHGEVFSRCKNREVFLSAKIFRNYFTPFYVVTNLIHLFLS